MMIGLLTSSCEQPVEIPQETNPQFSQSSCEGLAPDDLDLDAGFQGTFGPNPSGDSDFIISQHQPIYQFPAAVNSGSCEGVCGFRIIFDQPSGQINTSLLQISEITMSYNSGNGQVETPVTSFGYNFSFPYLDIYNVVVNTWTDYEVSFDDNMGSSLSIDRISVSDGGLCVIANVAGIDPNEPFIVGPIRPNGQGSGRN